MCRVLWNSAETHKNVCLCFCLGKRQSCRCCFFTDLWSWLWVGWALWQHSLPSVKWFSSNDSHGEGKEQCQIQLAIVLTLWSYERLVSAATLPPLTAKKPLATKDTVDDVNEKRLKKTIIFFLLRDGFVLTCQLYMCLAERRYCYIRQVKGKKTINPNVS